MPLVKTVHMGGVDRQESNLVTFVRGKQHKILYELNNWWFDYFYAHGERVRQLPPLDDWCRSADDPSYWYIIFPADGWSVWIRSEPVEF